MFFSIIPHIHNTSDHNNHMNNLLKCHGFLKLNKPLHRGLENIHQYLHVTCIAWLLLNETWMAITETLMKNCLP